jgi:hypothetical protein
MGAFARKGWRPYSRPTPCQRRRRRLFEKSRACREVAGKPGLRATPQTFLRALRSMTESPFVSVRRRPIDRCRRPTTVQNRMDPGTLGGSRDDPACGGMRTAQGKARRRGGQTLLALRGLRRANGAFPPDPRLPSWVRSHRSGLPRTASSPLLHRLACLASAFFDSLSLPFSSLLCDSAGSGPHAARTSHMWRARCVVLWSRELPLASVLARPSREPACQGCSRYPC